MNKSIPDLWQKPKKKLTGFEEEWYQKQVVGRDKLNDTMKNLSASAGLSKIYTNHCIRATVVTVMGDNFNNREIMLTTGHKSEMSLNSYANKLSAKKKLEISYSLAKELNNEIPEKVPKQNEIPVENNPEPQQVVQAEIHPPPAENLPLNNNEADFEPIQEDALLALLDKVEKENNHLFSAPTNPQPLPKPQGNILVPVQPNVPQIPTENQAGPSNYSSVQANVSNKNVQPVMYFHGSNVTINYHYYNQEK